MELTNTTSLNTDRLVAMIQAAVEGWPLRCLRVRVRYSRGADFSGTCYYRHGIIYVNLGRRLRYPYRMGTSIARAKSDARYWWKPTYTIELADGYEIVLFVFLHEFYHWLVKRARRNPRQKESMCDRFATRILADGYGCIIRDEAGLEVPRQVWDFQDVEGFVAGAREARKRPTPFGKAAKKPVTPPSMPGGQLLLFDV